MKPQKKQQSNAKQQAMIDINKEYGCINNLACRNKKEVINLISYKQNVIHI